MKYGTFAFDVACAGEPAAGLSAYTERVIVDVESGDPGGDVEGRDFGEYMRDALAGWYDGAGVEWVQPDQWSDHVELTASAEIGGDPWGAVWESGKWRVFNQCDGDTVFIIHAGRWDLTPVALTVAIRAYFDGHTRGEYSGANKVRQEMRKALGLEKQS